MNHIKILFIFVVLTFVQIGFSQTADVQEGCFPLTVQFTAPGAQSTWYWDFKDGATSNLENPSNTFIGAGSFDVEFRATSSGSILGTVTIDVYTKPTAEFTTDTSRGCAPLTVNFTDTTTLNPGINITNYTWVFGDGQSANGSTTTHIYQNEGNYSVTLQLETNLITCNATENYDDLISLTNPPLPFFTATPNSSCDSFLVSTFTNNSNGSGAPLTYSWDFGNTNTSTLDNPPAQSYTAFGNYPITLLAADTNGCERTYQSSVSLGSPMANFTVKDTLCINTYDTIFNTSTSGNYSWNFGPGASLDPSINNGTSFQGYVSGLHPLIRFSTPGIHTVTHIITSGLCADTISYDFFVQDPIPDFTSSPTYSCSDPMIVDFTPVTTSGVTYEWNFYDGTSSTSQNPTDILIVQDTTIYSINGPNAAFNYFSTFLTITTTAGCIDSYVIIDTIHEPNALLIPDVVDGCLPLTVQFSDSSSSNEPIVNWEWFFGDGNSVSVINDSPQTHTYTVMGEYDAFLIITNSAGCIDTSYRTTIKVGDVIIPDFSVDITSVCPGDSVQFTDITTSPLVDSIDTWHYSTEADRMFSCYQNSGPKWSFTNETGLQDVTLTVGFNGCFSSVTKVGLIDVKGPIAEINYICSCDSSFNINFADSSHSATSITWNFGDGNSSIVSDTNYQYAITGDYTVILEAINPGSGCPTSYDTTIVRIRDIQANFGFDSLICQSVNTPFDASSSQDVQSFCNMGYTWSFSDPGTRPITTGDPNEAIPFPVTGPNEVTLVVTDINGCKDTASTFVEVFGIEADFDMDDDFICTPTLVTFSDSSSSDTTIVDWQWTFGDGQSYVGQDTAHTYTINLTSFDVKLEITNAVGCKDEIIKSISVYNPVSLVSTIPNLTNMCSGDSISFNATDYTTQGSNLNFNWNFMDGDTTTIQNPTHAFDTSGSYQVSLVYEEISSGCKDSLIRVINVQDYPVAVYFTDDTASFRCFSNPVINFYDSTSSTSSYTTLWDFGDSSSQVPNNATPVWAYSAKGTYTAQLIVETTFGCKDTFQRQFDIIGPEGTYSVTDNMVCVDEVIQFSLNSDTVDVGTYTWDFADGTDSTDLDSVNHSYSYYPTSGRFLSKLILFNADSSCSAQDTATIFIHEVLANFNRKVDDTDTTICLGDPFSFTNTSSGEDVWTWNFGDGQSSFNTNFINNNYAVIGNYDVTLGVQNTVFGCTDTITKTIIVDSIPDIATIDDTICEGNMVNLDVTNPYNLYQYNWSPPISVVNPNIPNTSSQTLYTTTVFTVTVTDTFSSAKCPNSAVSTITVINELFLEDFDTLVVIGDTVYLPINFNTDFYNLNWTPEEGLSCLDCGTPFINPVEDIIFHLEVTDKLGCFTSEADYDIKVHPETFVKLPTTFTPNGDGVNDIIYLKSWGIKELLEFKIFNRWGELVFETDNINVGWNGYYKGVLQNNDIYVYKVMVQNWKEEEQTLEGHINLMR